jgi:YjbE family integral membrane protein
LLADVLLELQTPAFWVGLLQIIGIDIVLSGDNAVVIALAARRLPEVQRRRAVMIGTAAAIALRVTLTVFAALLLGLPWVKTVGALLLLWIAVRLIIPDEEAHGDSAEASGFWQAVRIIMVADFVMSLDNVIGIAAAAHGSLLLLVLGLLISIPLIVFSSQIIMRWMDRLPIIVTVGGALLGWVAGVTLITDPAHAGLLDATPWLRNACGIAGVALVLAAGAWLKHKRLAAPPVDLDGGSTT